MISVNYDNFQGRQQKANVFEEFAKVKAKETIRAHRAALDLFSVFLGEKGVNVEACLLWSEAAAWRGLKWQMVDAFVGWQIDKGYSIASVNHRLYTVKTYAGLASKAEAISPSEIVMINAIDGISEREGKRIDKVRHSKGISTRRGAKKAVAVSLSDELARRLKCHPDTPVGRRDALLMSLLIDHGLRCDEASMLALSDFDMKSKIMTLRRPKVGIVQHHRISPDTIRALVAWIDSGDCPSAGPVLRSSRKGGHLTHGGMTKTAISERVRALGAALGVDGLSAHDCRHYWATYWAGKVSPFRLQEAGGWSDIRTARVYVEKADVANDGMY